ncbi:MAG: hypothetical protein ACLUVG_22235 [Phocaeicola vulgatus]
MAYESENYARADIIPSLSLDAGWSRQQTSGEYRNRTVPVACGVF